MANPTLTRELDDLYARYTGVAAEMDTLGFDDSYAASSRRADLDYQRQQYRTQFERYKAEHGPEYEAHREEGR